MHERKEKMKKVLDKKQQPLISLYLLTKSVERASINPIVEALCEFVSQYFSLYFSSVSQSNRRKFLTQYFSLYFLCVYSPICFLATIVCAHCRKKKCQNCEYLKRVLLIRFHRNLIENGHNKL